ncbi:unnamed protein product [Owenia fusiformis]|uniref:Uncharacterized protein n=1 Tax=Owenia fusiformis TaxID=6347 RepID=A0A8J1TKU1_OWEFU|nr:unnamed protein product [Owenia fusiformis]
MDEIPTSSSSNLQPSEEGFDTGITSVEGANSGDINQPIESDFNEATTSYPHNTLKAANDIEHEDEAFKDCSEGHDWSQMPDTVMLRIYMFLFRDIDRSRLALTCKRLYNLFQTACLWRRRTYNLTGMPQNEQIKALGFSKKHGAHLRYIKIYCYHPSYNICKRFQKTVTTFLGYIHLKARLREFRLLHLDIDRYWRFDFIRQKLFCSLARFFRHQRAMRVFDMSSASVSLPGGCRLLFALAEGAKNSLEDLNLTDYFQSRSDARNNQRFQRAMSRFNNLTVLQLNYNCVSDDLLLAISSSCGTTLKLLRIKVHRYDPHHHQIEKETWKAVTKLSPYVNVEMSFWYIGRYSELSRLLVSKMPLTYLYIRSGSDHEDEWHLNQLVMHIAGFFSKTLEYCHLDLVNTHELIDSSLLEMLPKMKNLTSLELNCNIIVNTMEEICKLQRDFKIGLQRCIVTALGLTELEYSMMSAIKAAYKDMIEHRGLDFDFSTDYVVS